MKRFWIVMLATLAACDTGTPPAPVPKPPDPAPAPKEPAPPAYKSPWSGFKVGAFADYELTMVHGENTDRAKNRYELKALTEEKAVVTHTSEMGGIMGKSSMDTNVSLKHPPMSNQPKEQTTGTETITVKAGSFECTWVEFTIKDTTTRQWSSPKVPGGLVKSVSTNKGASPSVTTTELVKFADGP